MSTLTCHTNGCAASGRPVGYDLTWTDMITGETHTVPAFCGPCGQQITDIA